MKSFLKKVSLFPSAIIGLVVIGVIILAAVGIYRGGSVLHNLFSENIKLKQALTNLTEESRIGYAKVLSQQTDEKGKVLSTTLKFVETSRDNELNRILEKEFTVEGDIVHFDALIVKFGNKMVMDGKKRSLYLWRRVYGDQMRPLDGFPIEEPGAESQRYRDLLKELPIKQRELFWSSIWELANNPKFLEQYEIEAVYGNVTYTKLKKGLIYIFRITASGQIYPEIIPEI